MRENIHSGDSADMDLPVNANHLLYWRAHAQSFQGFAALGFGSMPLGGSRPEIIGIAQHTANFFSLLGVQPILGRTLLSTEEQPGHNVVILTEGLWRRRFAADPNIIGHAIPLDGRPYTVIGVLPASFVLPAPGLMSTMHGTAGQAVEAFVPFGWSADQLAEIEGDHNYFGIARLKPGVSLAQATAEMNTLEQAIGRQTPDHVALSATVTGLQPYLTAGSRSALLMLFAAVGTVLLIGCVNITNLLLARAAGREHEAALRAALGATSAQLVRSAVTEPLILAAGGCLLGLASAALALPWLAHALPSTLPLAHPLRMDAPLVLFAIGASLLCALLCGLLPAIRFVRIHPQQALRAESRTTSEAAGGKQLRRSLVIAEVAASVTLVVLAGMFLLSLYRLLRVDRGFVTEHVVSASVVLPDKQYSTPAAREAFYRSSLEHLRQLPGVRSAGVISVLPLDGDRWGDMISLPTDTRPLWSRPNAKYRWTSSGFFETMRIPLISGRFFTQDDLGKNVAVISERAARIAWHGKNPVGQFFRRGDPDAKLLQVIGVVGDVRAVDLSEQPTAMVYVPLTYRSHESGTFVLRADGDAASLAGSIRKAIGSVDDQAVVTEVRTMDAVVDDSLAARNFQLHSAAGFRCLRARPCRARHLRRRCLLRIAAHARARHPYRARRAARADLPPHPGRWRQTCLPRQHYRHRRRRTRSTRHQRTALRRRLIQLRHRRCGRSRPAPHRQRRQPAPRHTCHTHRSRAGPPRRIDLLPQRPAQLALSSPPELSFEERSAQWRDLLFAGSATNTCRPFNSLDEILAAERMRSSES